MRIDCTDSHCTFPSRPTHETDTPDKTTMRRSRVQFWKSVSLKPQFDLKTSVTATSKYGFRKNCSYVARRRNGTTRIAGKETSCKHGVHSSRKEEHLARPRGKDDEVRDERQFKRLRRPESKEQDRAERLVQNAQHSVVGTRDETTADKEDQGSTSRARTTTTSNPGLRKTPRKDVRMGVRPRQTVLRVGGADSRRGRCYSVATAEEVRDACGTVTGNVPEGYEFSSTKDAQPNNEAGARGRTDRPGETSGTAASDGSTAEDDSEVQCNLKMMNEQQRAILRKSGKQLFMDKYGQLTTGEAGRTDLAEIGKVRQSVLLSTCELLGGRTLQISRDTGCDLLTREGSSRAAGLLRDNCSTICWFRVSCALWCPWRWRDSDASDKTNNKLHKGRRLVRAVLKLATHLLNTGGLFVWEWPRGCQAWELPEMKMFQKRNGDQLLYSDMDACELGVRTR